MTVLATLALLALDGWALLRLLSRPDVGVGDLVVYLVFAGFLGFAVASRAASRVFGALREAAATGAPVGPGVVRGLVTLGAAALLAWPGPMTDVIALVLLVPWIGQAVARRLHARGRGWLAGRGVFVGATGPVSWGGADPRAQGATRRDDTAPPNDTRRAAPRFDHPVA